MDKVYDPAPVEAAWYDWWNQSGYFGPDVNSDSNETFTIVIPPPNVTGSLHIGHALTNSIQDTLCRYHRMNGKRTLWIPGTDHAGIATQSVVERKLWRDEKITKYDLGRDAFIDKVWEWKHDKGNRIYDQLKRLGSSLDWERETFTMDETRSRAVNEAFVRLFEEGLIYREKRLVHWCCTLRTAISDLEVDQEDIEGPVDLKVPGYDTPIKFGCIWSFAYKLVDSDEELIVATTRPETMLGDTAVAVHPEDPRYKHLHGKKLQHPFLDRQIPIVLDDVLVDMDFGTGAVKVTPAHDANDFATGKRHNLEMIEIINDDGTLNENCGSYQGLPRLAVRQKIIEDLESLGLYKGMEPNPMRLGICSRSGDVIEPILKPQWWVDTNDMALQAANAVRNNELEILPPSHESTWFYYLDNIRPWCISRQLWWGHRCPAYLINTEEKEGDTNDHNDWVTGRTLEEATANAEKKLGHSNFTLDQDPDVLDTWFSSGLFPFSVFGWPEESEELSQFYPTSLLETGHDILFFWVARMVMMGLKLTDTLPFKQVFLHSMVRDAHGLKMSKSLGNVIDPIDVIEGITLENLHETIKHGNLAEDEIDRAIDTQKTDFPHGISECGTDALRFALCAYTAQGSDINLDIKRVEGYRNFCNKIWQGVSLTKMFLKGYNPEPTYQVLGSESLMDTWMLSRLARTIEVVRTGFSEYNFSKATSAIHSFWIYDFCDVYLEVVKAPMFAKGDDIDEDVQNTIRNTIYYLVETFLRLLHPFMPFITEELWQRIPKRESDKESIMISSYPVAVLEHVDVELENEVDRVRKIITSIREMLGTYSINRKQKPTLILNANEHAEVYHKFSPFITILAYLGSVEVTTDLETPPVGCAISIPDVTCELYLNIAGLVNKEKELKKINNKINNCKKQIAAFEKKINAADFEIRVPLEFQEATHQKLAQRQNEFNMLEAARSVLENME
eukprot:TRINITY_DN8580_c0_g1_i1.p1 TRINITY_DN8580_c0_g1~~TRINITY_DN8580_c0_g1_i1.p1  ORF type:complete len:1044 (-),score=286.92 TRINITY_DN8580_c0_g1_i1:31-2904(-)